MFHELSDANVTRNEGIIIYCENGTMNLPREREREKLIDAIMLISEEKKFLFLL